MLCRVSFERGKERCVHLVVVLRGTTGSLLLIEDNSSDQRRGLIRGTAPLAGSDVCGRTFISWSFGSPCDVLCANCVGLALLIEFLFM